MISVIGRFLEHSRVYYCLNGGEEEVYIGSADLMPRNIDHRVEVLTPIRDAGIARRIRHEILPAYLADNVKARVMQPNGSYARRRSAAGRTPESSQEVLLNGAGGAKKKRKRPRAR